MNLRLPFLPPRRSCRCPGPCDLRITAQRPCCAACYRLLPDDLTAMWVGVSLRRHRDPKAVDGARVAIADWFAANPVQAAEPIALVGGRHRSNTQTIAEEAS